MRIETVTNKQTELQKPVNVLEAMAKRKKITVDELVADARANEVSPTPTQARVLLLAERAGI